MNDCNECPPPEGSEGFFETNADRIPVPGGYSPSEQIIYAEAMACLCKPLDVAIFRQIFLLLTQAHWSHKDNFGPHIDGLCQLQFDRTDETPITIRLADDFKTEETFQKPSIFVEVNQMEFKRLVQDDRTGFSGDLGTVYRSWLTTSTLVASHYAASKDVAFKMADNTMYFYLGIRESVMQKMSIPWFEPKMVGPAQKFAQGPDTCFRVDTVIQFQANYNISTTIESHRLKQFAIGVEPK